MQNVNTKGAIKDDIKNNTMQDDNMKVCEILCCYMSGNISKLLRHSHASAGK
jgi:hypothetical protein